MRGPGIAGGNTWYEDGLSPPHVHVGELILVVAGPSATPDPETVFTVLTPRSEMMAWRAELLDRVTKLIQERSSTVANEVPV